MVYKQPWKEMHLRNTNEYVWKILHQIPQLCSKSCLCWCFWWCSLALKDSASLAEQNKQDRDREGSPPWGRTKCNLGGGSCGERILVEVRVLKSKNLSLSHASWLGWAVSKGEGSRAFCLTLESWAALQTSTQELADCFWLFPSASLPPGLAQSCKCINTLNRLT